MSGPETTVRRGDLKRLSPWAILHFAARTVMQIATSAYALIPAAYGLYQAQSVVLIFAAVLLGIGLILLAATLKFLNFSYQIRDSTVQIRQGVFAKKNLNLRFDRIQNINIEHPFYFRPLGLVTVKIDGAGSASEEVFLAALELEEGEQVRARVQQFNKKGQLAAPAAGGEPAVEADDHNQTLLLTRSLSDLVVHGLTNNRAWIILGALAALYGQASEQINAYVSGMGLDFGNLVSSLGVYALFALVASGIVFGLVIMAGLSVLGSIFTYYGYQLHRTDDAFLVRRGLASRHEINMKKSRIQAVRIRRDWLDMALGRMNVIFEQISHPVAGEDGQSFGRDTHILVPSVEDADTRTLLREALNAEDVAGLEFTGISKRYLAKMIAIVSACYLLVALYVGQAPSGDAVLAGMLFIWLVHMLFLVMGWRRWGLALNGDTLYIRKGVIGVNHAVIPAFKVQEISRLQTPLMRRHGLSSLRLSVASGSYSVPFLPDALVVDAINNTLYNVEGTDRSWM